LKLAAIRLGVAALILAVAASAAAAQDIVVASKIDTEGALLGNMIAAVLEQNGLPIRNKIQLGPTEIVRGALLAGQIDVYPEYTGNGGRFFKREGDPAWKDPVKGYELIRQLDLQQNRLVWLQPAAANNTWAIAVRHDLADTQHVSTLDDFARYVNAGGAVKLAASAEFVQSAGGLPVFEQTYGFKLQRRQLLVLVGGDTSATIRAAAEGTSGVNASMAYGTDGALAVLKLIPLVDSKAAQVVYRPAPVIREAVLRQHPAIEKLLGDVFATLTLETLQTLNAKIAVEGLDAREVAADYLKAKGFIR
jgi:osmoprotectant transport system substrate-binding protein